MTTKKEPLMSKFKGKSKERYVMLRYWLLNSPAWRSLTGNARALYIEIAQRYNGRDNGRLSYSVREAAEALHISKSTAGRLLKILQERGLIICTKRGAFSLKTTKDASEWQLTEHDCDHPVAHATKDFMRWHPPADLDIDALNRQPPHHRKSKTRVPPRHRTDTPVTPYGYPSDTVKAKKRRNGYPSDTVKAQNETFTDTPVTHLQLPGRGREPGVRDFPSFPSFPEGEPAETKPWSTPTVEEIVPGTLPTKPAARTNGAQPEADVGPEPIATVPSDDPIPQLLRRCDYCNRPGAKAQDFNGRTVYLHDDCRHQWADAAVNPPGEAAQTMPEPQVVAKQPEAVASAHNQAERAPPAADVISTPDPAPARPMLPGDRQREAIRARNQEALRRAEAEMKRRAGLQ
jgi:hypothetical protein